MILGPLETYELLLHTGKPPKRSYGCKQHQTDEKGTLLPFPLKVAQQNKVLELPPKISSETLIHLHSLNLRQETYTSLVTSKNLRRSSRLLECVVFDMPLPDNSILQIADDVFLLCPALCLLVMARMSQISDEELIFAISQLCSRYAYAISPYSDLVERVPHTSVKRIKAYVAKFNKRNGRMPKGSARLLRLLPHAIDATRSPREIAFGLILNSYLEKASPHTPLAEVNKYIELTSEEQYELGKSHLESDFVWEGEKLIIEYNGGIHAGQREEDSARTNILRYKGYMVEILTSQVLDNFDSFIRFLHRLEGPLKFKAPRTANEIQEMRTLHARIIGIANRSGRFPRKHNGK